MEIFELTSKFFDDIKDNWEKPRSLMILWAIVFVILDFIKSEIDFNFFKRYWIFFVILINIILGVYWWFSTKRGLLLSKKYRVMLALYFEEKESERCLRDTIDNTISEINDMFGFLKVERLPFSKIRNEKEAETYIEENPVDTLIFANVNDINDKDSQYVSIDNMGFYGKLKKSVLNIYKTQIDLQNELNIRLVKGDFYFINHSKNRGKSYVSKTLKEKILYSSAIYLLFYTKFEEALKILKELKKIQEERESQNSSKYILSHKNDSERTTEILANVFFGVAYYNYVNYQKKEDAYAFMKELDHICPNQFTDANRYIFLARLAYENGDLKKAEYYTETAAKMPDGERYTHVNRGFFSIYKNDLKGLVKHYKKVFNYSNTTEYQGVDIVDFLERERKKENLSNRDGLFDFAEAIITKLYIDDHDGIIQINTFIEKYKENSEFESAIKLAEKVRNKKK